MASAKQFKGQCYAGYQKFDIHFSVSTHGYIELEYDNGQKLEIPLQQTVLELMGDPETTLQISWTETSGLHVLQSRDPALFDSLLRVNLPASIQAQVLGLQKKQQQLLKSERQRVPVYLSLITAFLFGSYFLLSQSVSFVTELIPYEWEQKIGSFAFENYLLGKRKIEHPEVDFAMNSIIERIDQFDGAEMTYQLAVIDEDMINAFAFPGGFVVVTSGLISHAENPEQVAAVLSHELTHVLERHSMRKLVRQAGLGILIGTVFGDASALSQLIELSSQLDSLSFDRSQERHADDGAIKIMQAAGLSPQHLAAFFNTIKQQDSIAGDIPEIFRTHPLTDERIERVTTADEPELLFTYDLDWHKVKQLMQ